MVKGIAGGGEMATEMRVLFGDDKGEDDHDDDEGEEDEDYDDDDDDSGYDSGNMSEIS